MKTKPSILKKLSLILLVLLASAGLNAQVAELKSSLELMKASSDAAKISQAAHIESLIYDLLPSVTIREGKVATYSVAPFVSVDVDIPSIGKIWEDNPLFAKAELLTIQINSLDDLKLVLDLTSLTAFPNLKYVYFLCSVNCTPEQVNALVKEAVPGILLYYLISIPS
jgi:hypothetical protein